MDKIDALEEQEDLIDQKLFAMEKGSATKEDFTLLADSLDVYNTVIDAMIDREMNNPLKKAV